MWLHVAFQRSISMLCYFIMKHINHNAVTCLDVFTFGVIFQISSSAENMLKNADFSQAQRNFDLRLYPHANKR